MTEVIFFLSVANYFRIFNVLIISFLSPFCGEAVAESYFYYLYTPFFIFLLFIYFFYYIIYKKVKINYRLIDFQAVKSLR